MKKSLFVGLSLIIYIALAGCSSGKKAYTRGDYYQSVMTSVNRLQRNPGHKKSISSLRSAYPRAIEYYETQAKNKIASNDPYKWKAVVDYYNTINWMYEAINQSPGALAVIPNPINHYADLEDAKNNAAEEAYNRGLVALGNGTREDAKVAFKNFEEANSYVPGYKDVVNKMEESLWAATLKVLVEPIPVTARNLEISAEFFENKFNEYLLAQNINEFVRFFTIAEAEAINLQPDQVIALGFDEFQVGQIYFKEKEIEMKKDSVLLASTSTYSKNSGSTGNYTDTSGGNVNTSGRNSSGSSSGSNTGSSSTGNSTSNTSNSGSASSNSGSTSTTGQDSKDATNTGATSTSGSAGAGNDSNSDTKNSGNQGDKTNTSAAGSNTNSGTVSSEPNQSDKTNTSAAGSNTNTNTVSSEPNTGTNNTNSNDVSSGKGNDPAGSSKDAKTTGKDNKNEDEPKPKPTKKSGSESGTSNKITVCHLTGSGKSQTLEIDRSALKAHLDHGDITGACISKKDQKSGDFTGAGAPANLKADGDVYGTVKATVFIYTKTISSNGILDFKIIDAASGSVVSQEKMAGEYEWITQWATFNGDERALTPEQLELSKLKEAYPPSNQDLFIEFTRPIFDQMTGKVRQYYRSF